MADNYLESRYEEYLERKRKKESLRKAAFRTRLDEYKKTPTNTSAEHEVSSSRPGDWE